MFQMKRGCTNISSIMIESYENKIKFEVSTDAF